MFRLGVTFNPNVLPWVTAFAVLVVFVLTFFTWVGFSPGGVPVITQSAWQAGFSSQSVDKDLEKEAIFPSDAKAIKEGKAIEGPGASVLLIFFLFLLILTLLLVFASAALGVVAGSLPQAVQRLKPWRWGITAILGLLAFFFLGFQVVTNMPLERKTHAEVDRMREGRDAPAAGSKEAKLLELRRGEIVEAVRRGAAMTWTAWLMFFVFLFAAMLFWIERSPHRPPPRLEFRW